MSESELSLHFALLHNLSTGEFDALKPEKVGEIHFDALDVTIPEAELGRRLFYCAQWNSQGRTQLQSTLGLAQLISDNPLYFDFTQGTLQKYYTGMEELKGDADAVEQLRMLLVEDIKEIAIDSKVIGMETMAGAGTVSPRQLGTYWHRGKWEMGWTFYKSLDKVQDALNQRGPRGYRYPLPVISIPAPSVPDFRTISLPPLSPDKPDKTVAAVIPIWFGTNRERVPNPAAPGDTFSNNRDPEPGVKVYYGLARVSIPKRHDEGRIERPKWWKLEFFEDEARHFVLKRVDVLDETVWIRGASAPETEGIVFVHGFNVTFEDAMYRSAQLAHDLNYEGPVFCFSWASCGGPEPWQYTTDEGTIQWSEDHLERFLKTITNHLGLKRLHVIAHSMGNRAVLGVLEKWVKVQDVAPLSQLVLAAPDLDAATLSNRSTHFSKCDRVTLYASRADWAILASRKIHKYPIVGDADPPLVIVGVDTIDATVAGKDVLGLGHSYFAQKSKIFSDLFYVITQHAIPARKRAFIHPSVPPGYYVL
jgi:esterase/lipase superfamily enzyme